jgi:hypothetical protein
MNDSHDQKQQDGPMADSTLRTLYPSLNDAELKRTRENLDRYLVLALRIAERMNPEPRPKETGLF